MRMDKLIKQRFSELAEKAVRVEASYYGGFEGDYGTKHYHVDSEIFKEWATSVLSLLQRVFGEHSVHYQAFYEHFQVFREYSSEFEDCRGIFQSAREDYEGGYLFSVRALVTAEVLDDALEQAAELLKAGYKDPACVLAGVALESTLKEICIRQGVPHSRLDRMNADLCKAGVYNVGMQKQITAWAAHRNNAAHGDWNEYDAADVDYFIKGVTRFIAEHL